MGVFDGEDLARGGVRLGEADVFGWVSGGVVAFDEPGVKCRQGAEGAVFVVGGHGVAPFTEGCGCDVCEIVEALKGVVEDEAIVAEGVGAKFPLAFADKGIGEGNEVLRGVFLGCRCRGDVVLRSIDK